MFNELLINSLKWYNLSIIHALNIRHSLKDNRSKLVKIKILKKCNINLQVTLYNQIIQDILI